MSAGMVNHIWQEAKLPYWVTYAVANGHLPVEIDGQPNHWRCQTCGNTADPDRVYDQTDIIHSTCSGPVPA